MANIDPSDNLTLLIRVLHPTDRIILLRDVMLMGIEKATSQHFSRFFSSFPSLTLAEEVEDGNISGNTASIASWDYDMPDGQRVVVNLFQDGPYLHINSDKIQPIRYWVVQRLYEDGMILVSLDMKKDKFFSKKYYKVYEILNFNNYKPNLCYS